MDGSVEMQMPTEWEQDVAEIYVNEHILDRPNTNIKTVFICASIFVAVTELLTWLVRYFFINVGFAAFLHPHILKFYNEHQWVTMTIICTIIIIVELFFCLKYMIIGIVKFYQHYAPEQIRRRCLFMPTCSEYAILAVQKYGCIIGTYKSIYRLVYRCRGNIYRIDYP